jgi:hypothetical protein
LVDTSESRPSWDLINKKRDKKKKKRYKIFIPIYQKCRVQELVSPREALLLVDTCESEA